MPSTGKSEPRGRRFPGEALQNTIDTCTFVIIIVAAAISQLSPPRDGKSKVKGTGGASGTRMRL